MPQSGLPKQSRKRLGLKHAVHLQAAEYWLALGKLDEASRELHRIQLSRRSHPDVQRVSARINQQLQAARSTEAAVLPGRK